MNPTLACLVCAFVLSFAMIPASVSISSAGRLDGSACDDAGLDRTLRRLCRTYCDARACASDETGTLAPPCGRLLARYLEKSEGKAPPCDVVPPDCREQCRRPAWRGAKACREKAAEALEACGTDQADAACAAKVATELEHCFAHVRKLYRACIDECTSDDVCALPKDSGPCDALIPRWYFNADTASCERFVWGGCGGNANNFETRAACRNSCGAGDVCELPADAGPCDAAIPRWYFHSETGSCEQFIYGGCPGNDNNFETFAECLEACGAEVPCATMRCKDYQACLVHEPTGEGYCADTCEGFECPSGETCELQEVQCIRAPCPPVAHCVPTGMCGLPKDPGDCLAAIPRWWHNPRTGRCEEFLWGSCGGNANNFEALAECQLACMGCDLDGGARDVCKTESCDPATNYCRSFTGGVPGSQTTYECLPLPEACRTSDADCSCLKQTDLGCSCRRDDGGTFAMDCAAP